MASDRSRNSYDEAQQYRAVGMQQGRVVTDSDFNEAQDILAEESRREALDLVGPSGTPDDGYKISIPSGLPAGDFAISAGTMYVGGLRVSLPADPDAAGSPSALARQLSSFVVSATLPPHRYSQQPDWIAPEPVSVSAGTKELIWLELEEREISAVEDPALLEPALGGPDTATRTRIIQRIRRSPVTVNTCVDALTAQRAAWSAQGRTWDPATRRLLPRSELKVSVVPTTTATGPCDPVAQDGYLGAENQLIRVRLTTPRKFVWSYDNASFLYGVDHVSTIDPRQLVLTAAPVDEAHRPGGTRSVELLRGVTRLADGSISAETVGTVVASTDFKVDTRTLVLAQPLPANFAITPDQPLFVRIWEQELAFTEGTAVTLPDTGVQVTLRTPGGGLFVEGDYWTFAVRPSTPGDVYPRRYKLAFQPPEGPRRWATSLAVLDWTSPTQGAVAGDCRDLFDNLVELSSRKAPKSCCLTIDPSDLVAGSFQPILDVARNSGAFKICLLPGTYNLRAPIVLTSQHSGLVFESCRGGVVIAGGNEAAFADGIVQMDGATAVTFRDLRFSIPILPARGSLSDFNVFLGDGTEVVFNPTPASQPRVNPGIQPNVNVAETARFDERGAGLPPGIRSFVAFGSGIGIRAVDPIALTVEECDFIFPSGPDIRPLGFTAALGAGILLYGQASSRISIRRNTFVGRALPGAEDGRATIVGVAAIPALLAPSAANPFDFTTPAAPATGTPTGGTVTEAVAANQTAAATERRAAGDFIIAGAGGAQPGRPVGGSLPPPVVRSQLPGRMLPATFPVGEVSGNHFVGCSAAAFFCADTGSLRLTGNDVFDGIDGFLILPPHWLGAIAFLSAAEVSQIFTDLSAAFVPTDAAGGWNAVQAVSETVAAMTHPGHVWLATALMSLALPPSIAGRSDLLVLEAAPDRKALLDPLVRQSQSVFTASTSVLNPPLTAGAANLTTLIGNRLRALWGPAAPRQYPFFALPNQNLASIGFGSLPARVPPIVLALQCEQNDVDLRASSGTALLVMGNGVARDEAAILTANRFSNSSKPLPTAAAALVNRVTVTGNLIQNEQLFHWPPAADPDALREFWSLVLIPGSRPPDDIIEVLPLPGGDPVPLPGPLPGPNPNLNPNATNLSPTDASLSPNATARGRAAALETITNVASGGTVGIGGVAIGSGLGINTAARALVDPAWIPPLVAITGNVFKGYPVLPPRSLPLPSGTAPAIPDPFNTWLLLNTVSW